MTAEEKDVRMLSMDLGVRGAVLNAKIDVLEGVYKLFAAMDEYTRNNYHGEQLTNIVDAMKAFKIKTDKELEKEREHLGSARALLIEAEKAHKAYTEALAKLKATYPSSQCL